MKKIVLFLAMILCLAFIMASSCAEEESFLGTWYFSSYESTEDYPGTVFTADGSDQYFTVYTDGENLIIIDNRGYSENVVKQAKVESGVLSVSFEKFTLEDGKLIDCYGSVREVYTREPQERQIPQDLSHIYAKNLLPRHYDGTWTITRYGMNNAFIDAEAMGLTGKAVIKDGRIDMNWTRNGTDKSLVITFDQELNDGRLYTVVDDAVSYIVSMRDDHSILLNIGLDQSQWLMRKENVVDETVVHPDAPGFEQAFAANENWTESEESRNELANLLISTVFADGVDSDAIRADGPFWLALVSRDPAHPVLVCEGAGEHGNYLLTVGRGTYPETQEPFVYYHWTDRFFSSIQYPDENIADRYRNENLELVAGDCIWQVRIEAE